VPGVSERKDRWQGPIVLLKRWTSEEKSRPGAGAREEYAHDHIGGFVNVKVIASVFMITVWEGGKDGKGTEGVCRQALRPGCFGLFVPGKGFARTFLNHTGQKLKTDPRRGAGDRPVLRNCGDINRIDNRRCKRGIVVVDQLGRKRVCAGRHRVPGAAGLVRDLERAWPGFCRDPGFCPWRNILKKYNMTFACGDGSFCIVHEREIPDLHHNRDIPRTYATIEIRIGNIH
jgi:hypothetical protein